VRRDEMFVMRGNYLIIIIMNAIKCMIESREGEDLNHFLQRKHYKPIIEGGQSELHNRVIMYVIQPNFEDKDIYKVGVAAGQDLSKKRLTDYLLAYGVKSETNPLKGAKIFMVLYTKFEAKTQISKTMIRQLEAKVKRALIANGKKDRGNEWFNVPIAELLTTIRAFVRKDLYCSSSESDDDELVYARFVRKKNIMLV
jgi:hypothetical protein